jgi:phospholipid transport system substrate-binding protein
MKTFRSAAVALVLAAGGLSPATFAPATAAVDASNPQAFVQTLTTDGFAALKGDRATSRNRLRNMLATHVAVDQIGDRLIRRWLPTISPAQRAAYKQALPGYVVGTYADRLSDYSDATVRVVRTQPTAGGGADVFTQVVKPGRQPIPAVWSVVNVGGQWKVLNLRVAGINVAMAQAADFDAVVQRQGFDALIRMMKARG